MVTEEELGVRDVGIYKKFLFPADKSAGRDDEWWTSFIYRFYLRGIKSGKLQKLVYLLYILSYPISDAGISDILRERVNEIAKNDSERYHREIKSWSYKESNLNVLGIEEIMRLLQCSRRAAIDYKNTLEAMFTWFW